MITHRSPLVMPALFLIWLAIATLYPCTAQAQAQSFRDQIYEQPDLKPRDSQLAVAVGDTAPDFTLPAISGKTITLSSYRNRQNVMLSFVPAAWTPVCSDQWPGYNILQDLFASHDTVILGITVDNTPTLHSWVLAMGGLWFPVLSDFWPHGQTAQSYGLLRGDGLTERALVFIDKLGMIRFVHVGDINIRPPLETVMRGLQAVSAASP